MFSILIFLHPRKDKTFPIHLLPHHFSTVVKINQYLQYQLEKRESWNLSAQIKD